MRSDNLEYEKKSEADFLDKIIEEEARESDQYERDHLKETKESIRYDRPALYIDSTENRILNLKRGNTRHTHASGEIDERAIAKEAKKGFTPEAIYLQFMETIDREVNKAYSKLFTDTPNQSKISFVKDLIVYRNKLCDCKLTDSENDALPLEEKITNYSIKESLAGKATTPLTPSEQRDYNSARAIIAINKAMDEPKQKTKFLQEAHELLKEIDPETSRKYVQDIYSIAMTYELSD